MKPAPTGAIEPSKLADDVVREVLRSQWQGSPALILDSPPGAGKTGVVERLAVQALGLMRERCMVVTQTNQQALDLAHRLATGFPKLSFYLLVRDGLPIPARLRGLSNLEVADAWGALPEGPCVVVANATKWSWVPDTLQPFDLQIVDEAYQLPDYRFHQIAHKAHRVVLVGDPGQIDPVVACAVERWRDDPQGPHQPCPRALLARHPQVRRMQLPVSRRLPHDTVTIVQPAFYPRLPFSAHDAPEERGLFAFASGAQAFDRALDLASRGATMLLLELPPRITGEYDLELSATLADFAGRLVEGSPAIRDRGALRELEPDDIGIVCAHTSQVHAVRERLPGGCEQILVETADRFQGLERVVMLVHHPLSGRADTDAFHLDAGRLCVMLSRHRVGCFVFARGGLAGMLERNLPASDRILGIEEDPVFEGWEAQVRVLRELYVRGRVVPVQREAS